MAPVKIKIALAKKAAKLPFYASEAAAGADICACIDETILLEPGQTKLIPTGLKCEIPVGYEIQVRPRSGLALKESVTVLNTPGTVDADYRGEIGVILINHGQKAFSVEPGMRIAQIVVARALQAEFEAAGELTATARGEGGFGHTGRH